MAVITRRRNPPRKAAPATSGDSQLSEYERKCRAKMAQNVKFLQQLGIAHSQLQLKQELQVARAAKKQQKKASAKPNKSAEARQTLRRSSRVKTLPILAAAAERQRRRTQVRQQELELAESKKRRNRERRRKIRVAAEAAAAERHRRAENRASHNSGTAFWRHISLSKMPTILDFFKPVGAGKPRNDGSTNDPVRKECPSSSLKRPRSARDSGTNARKSTKPKQPNSGNSKSTKKHRHKEEEKERASKSDEAAPVTEDAESPHLPPQQKSEPFDGLSEYERQRLARMEANAKFLQKLGMGSTQLELNQQLQNRGLKQTKKSRVKKPKLSVASVRRSRRVRGKAAQEMATKFSTTGEGDASGEEEEEISFDDSDVFHYTINSDSSANDVAVEATSALTGVLRGFTFDDQAYVTDPTLKSVYSLSFSPFQEHGLIATGGHGGRVSVYPMTVSYSQTDQEQGYDDTSVHGPLMSFKAHTGWVSSVNLARSIRGERNLLLTAANDGVLKLWDLNRSSSVLRTPQELVSSPIQHTKGIFGMDVCGDSVVTCSKDGSVALSQFRDNTDKIEVLRRFEDHKGVVKSVAFAAGYPQRFASGGNDRVLRVFDLRVPGARVAAVEVFDWHSRVINSVRFHPTDDHLLMSAGFDTNFYMFDLRKPSTPVCTFVRPTVGGAKSSIFHPVFVNNGREVVAASDYEISLYKTCDGTSVSRGEADGKIHYIAADPFHERVVVAMGDTLQFAEYRWGNTE